MVKHGTGNWQTRHDALQARRKAAKLRKQQSDDSKCHRKRVQDCLANLVTNNNCSLLHIWVNTQPPDGGPAKEHEPPLSATRRRPRSVSLNEPPPRSSPKLGRGRRSHSFGEPKVHPRSKESSSNAVSASTDPTLWMCRAYFFGTKCGRS